ncbi:MAG: hypothetical protein Q8922_14200 [Bacteroidota bacterium]|nr:hypothetical protein [Bacteroidota bacterium]MDP4233250.1 hypothetical protein [Bacteroidota bacterium]MDP4242130.1 hypothetical protein [Bacteroidota bacterium]MDP4289071.1 hypothetical protein [Bacteroidota bacterium]
MRQVLRQCVWSLLLVIAVLPKCAIAQSIPKISSHARGGAFDSRFSLAPKTIEFEKNLGQVYDQFGKPMPEVLYRAKSRSLNLYLTKNGIQFVFSKHSVQPQDIMKLSRHRNQHERKRLLDTLTAYRMDFELVGSNPNPTITEEAAKPYYFNYYDKSHPDGLLDVPAFERLIYHDVYPEIDMVIYSTEQGMKYDFIVHPGGDPSSIVLSYDGSDSLRIQDGAAQAFTPMGVIREGLPFSFTGTEDNLKSVNASYVLDSSHLRFKIDHYDHRKTLVIDPPRIWGSYFGGSDGDEIFSLGVDKQRNIFVCGGTNSSSGIATPGAFQATYTPNASNFFLAKFTAAGSLLWCTYYFDGGNSVNRLGLDTSGNPIIGGTTQDTTGEFATAGAYQMNNGFSSADPYLDDIYLAKFSSAGVRLWGTYWGRKYGDELRALAVDSSNNIIIGIQTNNDSMATPGSFKAARTANRDDVVLAKFSPTGFRTWATYYGSGQIGSIAIGKDNAIFIAAIPSGSDMPPATAGAFDAIPTDGSTIVAFSPAGSRVWATYFPGVVRAICSDHAGSIYFGGQTLDDTRIATPGAYRQTLIGNVWNAFVERFDTSGKRKWGTYIGGWNHITDDGDDDLGLAANPHGDVIATGYTGDSLYIATTGEFQTVFGGSTSDAFLMKFDSIGRRKWGTYYGGTGIDRGNAVSTDIFGHILLAGYTESPSGIASSGSYQSTYAGTGDGFVAKFCDTIRANLSSTSADTICYGEADTLVGTSGFSVYQWRDTGSIIPGATSSKYILPDTLHPGLHRFTLDIADPELCATATDTLPVFIRTPPPIDAGPDKTMCLGSSVQIGKTIARYQYSWSPGKSLFDSTVARPIALPTQTTTYVVSVTDTNGCQNTDTVIVNVNNPPVVDAGPDKTVCSGTSVRIGNSITGKPPFIISWQPADGIDHTDSLSTTAHPAATTTYTVTATDVNGCQSSSSVTVHVNKSPVVRALLPVSICRGDSVIIGASVTIAGNTATFQWSPAAGLSDPTAQYPKASPKSTTVYTVVVTDGNGCTGSDTIEVAVADTLRPRISPATPSICAGDTVMLSVSSAYSSYKWSTGDTTSSILVTQSGDYSVHVTGTSGCSGTSAPTHVTVLSDSVPHPVLLPVQTQFCSGDSIRIEPAGTYKSYLWSSGDTTASIFVTKSGEYSVTVTNSAGCAGSSVPVSFTVEPRPQVQLLAAGPTSICEGDSVPLDVTPGFHYTWWNGTTKLPDTTQRIFAKVSGSYSVTATSASGCDSTSPALVITVNPRPVVAISGPESMCLGGKAQYTRSGPPGAVFWLITPASLGTITSGQGTNTIEVQWGSGGTGMLWVNVTAGGCEGISQLPITIGSHLTPLVSHQNPLAFCPGDSVTLDAGSGYATYQWSRDGNAISGATGQQLTTNQAGNYSVFVTDASGCDGSSMAATVIVYPLPAKPTISQSGGKLTSTPSSGYQWSLGGMLIPSDSTETISPDTDGIYAVTVTDAHGCSATSDPYNYSIQGLATVKVPALTKANPGSTIVIPLLLENAVNLAETRATTYAGVIHIRADLLTPTNPISTRSGNVWALPVAGPVGISDTLEMLAFVAGSTDPNCGTLMIDSFAFPNARVAVTRVNGEVCVAGACTSWTETSDTAFFIHSVVPNPSTGSFTIEYHIAEEGLVEMSLQDVLGRTVKQFKSASMKSGTVRETYWTDELGAGAYRLVLRSGGRARTMRLGVLR